MTNTDVGRNGIITRTAEIWLADDGVMRIVCKPGSVQRMGDARENIAAIVRLNRGRSRPILFDLRHAVAVNRQARDYYSEPRLADIIAACAYVADSSATRMIAIFLAGLTKPSYPSTLFPTVSEALGWLETFRS